LLKALPNNRFREDRAVIPRLGKWHRISSTANVPDVNPDYFSADYFTARRRFVNACERLGFDRHSLVIDASSPTAEPLTIDVAVAGANKPASALVVSSGVHGVEGFFGSAVQLAFMDTLPAGWRPAEDSALVMIHSLNPFGFAWQRRFNEENVDLNRNFLLPEQAYTGAPPLADVFRRTLKPAPWRMNFHNVRVARLALRHGVRSFWETLPVGQYEHPDWLFFGGNAKSQSAQLLEQLLPTLFEHSREVVHLDFHTGLGRWANWDLLLAEQELPENASWWREHFHAEKVKVPRSEGRSYQIRGGFGSWLQARFPNCHYRFATAEFGTYSPMRVVRALTDELHWHSILGHEQPDHWARRALTEAFAPRDMRWRATSLAAGLSLVERAAEALWSSPRSAQPRLVTT
jgi:predicted deacylase